MVSVPLRGRGFERIAGGAGNIPKDYDVSVPLRGRGFESIDAQGAVVSHGGEFPSPYGEEVLKAETTLLNS